MRIDKGKVMRNAWYLKRVVMKAQSFGACLRKAWRNEKLRIMQRLAQGLSIEEPTSTTSGQGSSPDFVAGCIAYYAKARPGQYFGD